MTNKKWFLYFLLVGIPFSIHGLIVMVQCFFFYHDILEMIRGVLFLLIGLVALFFAKQYYKKTER
ncbi:Predicted protein [Anoxybacillus flavithermus WK1]|uniref:Uncharacterized protein n=1 Tax=Anoxybacillus flavithermus (strain DSM 21510 / WK1) TaxID=491915 RepID=B7GKX2_ANOFW|nr:Predicted protein [Anoxybacillus flavithermus WK1]AST05461.1 hypothetical protein AF2641_00165 [Anoxybacillus flavithermus]